MLALVLGPFTRVLPVQFYWLTGEAGNTLIVVTLLGRIKSVLVQKRRRAEWGAHYHLRHAQVGHHPLVVGQPVIENRRMTIGDDFLLWNKGGRSAFLLGAGELMIGDRVFINSGAIIDSAGRIEIGDDVAVAYDAYIADTSSHGIEGQPAKVATVKIGSGSWIGLRATVLPGVTIGRRCVVAAHAVVAHDVPDDTLVAGTPAIPRRNLQYPPGVTRAWSD
jgi:acetyltransferase-like isoleucine patch superfamily enzyme